MHNSINQKMEEVNSIICLESCDRKIKDEKEEVIVSKLEKQEGEEKKDSRPSIGIEYPRQKRYAVNQKAKFIEYMCNRKKSEEKSNITWYAERNQVSRTTLYNLYNRFKKEFQEKQPGPRPYFLETIRDTLEELEQKEYERLQGRVFSEGKPLSANEERIIRTILQSAVSPMSAREIRDVIQTAFGVSISKRKIKRIINEYSQKAKEILQKMGIEELVVSMAIDEVFCGIKPVLTGVDLDSFALVICKKEDVRDHQVWKKVLSLFPSLKLVTSDRAQGIIQAVYLCENVLHQFDLFHFKRDANRQLRRLEAQAYRTIEGEYQSQKKWEKVKDKENGQDYQKEYKKRKEEALQAIDSFDRAETAIKMIFQALDIFDSDGNFQEPHKCLRNLERGARLLRKASPEKKIQNLADQVLDPHLFLYLSILQEKLLSFPLRWKKDCPAMSREKVIKIIASCWHSKENNRPLPFRKDETREQWSIRKQEAQEHLCKIQLAHLIELRQVQMILANFDEVFQNVTQALDTVFRASSLVESLNSHIRLCQQIKKGFNNDFLSLVALHWNMRRFEEGKRKHSSPFQILGIQGKNENWLDFLLSN